MKRYIVYVIMLVLTVVGSMRAENPKREFRGAWLHYWTEPMAEQDNRTGEGLYQRPI